MTQAMTGAMKILILSLFSISMVLLGRVIVTRNSEPEKNQTVQVSHWHRGSW
jgi:hypothetical protein